MAVVRLRDRHPIVRRLEELFDEMERLDIKLIFYPHSTVLIHNEQEYELHYTDSCSSYVQPVQDLPPSLDFKILKETEE